MNEHLASRVNHKPTVLSYDALATKQLLAEIETAFTAPATHIHQHLSQLLYQYIMHNIAQLNTDTLLHCVSRKFPPLNCL